MDVLFKQKKILLIISLCLVSIIFLSRSFYNAVLLEDYSSKDLFIIYNLSKLFLEKIDVYEYFFTNKTTYPPVWGHLCYIIFSPFSLLSFKIVKILWFFINLIIFFLIIKILKKQYSLNTNQTLFLSIISVSATPLTNTLGNGQLGLIFLLLFLTYWYSKSKFKFLILFLFSTKVSLGAIFILNSFLKKEKDFFYFIIITFISTIFYSFYVNDFSYKQFFNPILAILDYSTRFSFKGIGNLNDISTIFGIKKYFFIILNLILFISSIFLFNKKKSDNLFFSLIVLTLILFYHRIYDYVLLIPIAAYAIKDRNNILVRFIFFLTVIFFFHIIKINEVILNNFFSLEIINITGFLLLLACFLVINFKFNLKGF